jgi:hypothetical protein
MPPLIQTKTYNIEFICVHMLKVKKLVKQVKINECNRVNTQPC